MMSNNSSSNDSRKATTPSAPSAQRGAAAFAGSSAGAARGSALTAPPAAFNPRAGMTFTAPPARFDPRGRDRSPEARRNKTPSPPAARGYARGGAASAFGRLVARPVSPPRAPSVLPFDVSRSYSNATIRLKGPIADLDGRDVYTAPPTLHSPLWYYSDYVVFTIVSVEKLRDEGGVTWPDVDSPHTASDLVGEYRERIQDSEHFLIDGLRCRYMARVFQNARTQAYAVVTVESVRFYMQSGSAPTYVMRISEPDPVNLRNYGKVMVPGTDGSTACIEFGRFQHDLSIIWKSCVEGGKAVSREASLVKNRDNVSASRLMNYFLFFDACVDFNATHRRLPEAHSIQDLDELSATVFRYLGGDERAKDVFNKWKPSMHLASCIAAVKGYIFFPDVLCYPRNVTVMAHVYPSLVELDRRRESAVYAFSVWGSNGAAPVWDEFTKRPLSKYPCFVLSVACEDPETMYKFGELAGVYVNVPGVVGSTGVSRFDCLNPALEHSVYILHRDSQDSTSSELCFCVRSGNVSMTLSFPGLGGREGVAKWNLGSIGKKELRWGGHQVRLKFSRMDYTAVPGFFVPEIHAKEKPFGYPVERSVLTRHLLRFNEDGDRVFAYSYREAFKHLLFDVACSVQTSQVFSWSTEKNKEFVQTLRRILGDSAYNFAMFRFDDEVRGWFKEFSVHFGCRDVSASVSLA